MIIDENLAFDDLNKKAEEIQDPEKAAEIIKWQEISLKQKERDYKHRISSRTGI